MTEVDGYTSTIMRSVASYTKQVDENGYKNLHKDISYALDLMLQERTERVKELERRIDIVLAGGKKYRQRIEELEQAVLRLNS